VKFKEFYKYVFDFSRDPGFKNLSMETAVGLWELLLSEKCKFLNDWIEFLQSEKKDQQVVQKDTWCMLLELVQSTNGDFKNFVDDGAWPSMIDSFCEFYGKKHKK
jgi:DCN1-like protein 1/2